MDGNLDTPEAVLHFWFKEIEAAKWWRKDAEFDRLIGQRFGALHARGADGELFGWRSTPGGRLAEVIVLDQFSRNLYRDSMLAFAFDGMALVLAQEAVAAGADVALPTEQRAFLYMPYMHSESAAIHRVAVELFSAPGLEGSLDFELRHKAIIDRFGRYPHRNAVLGRESTAVELAFLKEPGSSF
ncbi:MAG TPA: DUF924 family protein [Rhodocyclaceae bacterium]